MSNLDIQDGTLVVGRPPTEFDEIANSFSTILADHDVSHVFVWGYVATLIGPTEAIETIDVVLEPLDRESFEPVASAIEEAGFWGVATPVAEAFDPLSNGEPVSMAPSDQVIPYLEVTFADDEVDEECLRGSMTAEVGDAELPIGPLELQVAYKLYLVHRTSFEDAVDLYSMVEERLDQPKLRQWCERLGIGDEYERLVRA